MPLQSTAALLAPMDLTRLRGLGAKLGERVKTELGCDTVGQLAAVVRQLLSIIESMLLDSICSVDYSNSFKNRHSDYSLV